MIDKVTYNQWETTDRGNLATMTENSDDFTPEFISHVDNLITHNLVTIQQNDFYRQKIQNLEEGEVFRFC